MSPRTIAGSRFLLAALLSLFLQSALAQGGSPVIEKELKHDVSPALRSILPVPPQARAPQVVPLLRLPSHGQRALQVDPVVQATPGAAIGTTAGLSFEGVADSDNSSLVAPSDANGAAGMNQYVQWVNSSFAVYDKSSGTKVYGPVAGNTLWTGFGGSCETNNDGDPVVKYDNIAHRWVMTQFANIASHQGPYYQCVAVSTSEDATGTYNRYAFQYDTLVIDYSKLSVWPDAYYITYNLFTANSGIFQGAEACALDRTAMLNGTTATQVCFTFDPSYGALLASDLDGATLPPAGSPNYLLGYDATNSLLNVWKFHVDFTTPANSTRTGPATVAVAAFNEACSGGACIPQPGTTTMLDSLGDRPMYRLAYRNFGDHESLVVNHSVTTGNGNVGVRWYELRSPASSTPTLYQQATWAPDSDYRWMGSIAMDNQGNMALGYSVSSGTTHPSIRYTGRLAGDALNTMGSENSILAGTASQTNNLIRWGDYTSMAIDPADDCTFWYTNQYIPTNGSFNWKTRIASFRFPSCVSNPQPVSVTPNSGIGATQTFAFKYSDPGGYANLSFVTMLFNNILSHVGACSVYYYQSTNTLQLKTDDGTGFVGSGAVMGSATTLQNSQCSIDVGASSVTGSGTNLTVNLAITFTSAFTGSKTIYMYASDGITALTSGWQSRGSWTLPWPLPVSVTPNAGSGVSRTFAFLFSDPYGASQLSMLTMLFNTSLTHVNGCSVYYFPGTNTLQLKTDDGTGFVGSGAIMGSATTLQNSQCSINAGASSAVPSGTNLTVNVAISFLPAFAGNKAIFMFASDGTSNLSSGWQVRGSWYTSNPPQPVSVSPNSGNGASQTFAFQFSDAAGYANLSMLAMLFNTGLTHTNGCSVYYYPGTNTVQLKTDSGVGFVGSGAIMGSATTLSNSQCTVNVGTSSAGGSGTNLTVTLAITFTPAFAGLKNIYMYAGDQANVNSGWQVRGTWNTGDPPQAVSVSPNSGTGMSQTFAFQFADPGGYSRLSMLAMLFNSGLTHASGCSVYYYPGTNMVQLKTDSGTGFVGSGAVMGSATTLSNSQCSINVAASSAVGSSNNLTVNLAITFAPAFAGGKMIYMYAADGTTGLTSGWQSRGTWTVGAP